MVFVDSNIWCYYFDKSAEEHEQVTEALEKIIEEDEVYVNTIVLMEVSHYLLKNLGAVKGKEKVDIFTSLPIKIEDFDYESFQESTSILAENLPTGIGGRDATIITAMRKQEVERIITHDKAFKRVREVNVIDPVEDYPKEE